MISKLAGGHGFFVRLPSQFVLRQTLQKSASDWCLCFELCEKRLCNRHDGFSFFCETKALLNSGGFRTARLRPLSRAFENVVPAFDHSRPVLVVNQAETGMAELDHREAILFAQAILHVVGNRVG